MPKLMAVCRTAWALILICLVLFAPVATPAGAEDAFYFVQITDTHLGSPENEKRTRRIVAAVNSLPMKIACVVHTGDICDRKIQNTKACTRAAEIFKEIKVPVYFLAGNHDIDPASDQSRESYTAQFSSLTYSREIQGVRFVFAYTDPLEQGQAMAGYDPFAAVAAELEKAGSRPILLFHHAPSVPDFYNNAVHPGWAEGSRWTALVNRYPVKAVVAGHFHRDELHWLGRVPLYVSGPVADKYGRQACYRIYEYKGGRLSYTAQYLD